MKCIYVVVVFFTITIISCSKNNNLSPGIQGKWVFTGSSTYGFAYPRQVNNPSLVYAGTSSVTNDSITINFDNHGNYTFLNHRFAPDNGRYTIAEDSFLIIQPDTADFVKFNYLSFSGPLASDTVITSPPGPVYAPYANFRFVSDTIVFKITGNNILFATAFISKNNAIMPLSNDTLLLNQNFNYFKRQ